MRPRLSSVALLLFGSGFCALVYQVAWLREFRLIFGASTAASAAVVAIFIGGLGFGGLFLGPRADRHSRPLLLYAGLEGTIAVCAALSPLLLMIVRAAYIASGGVARLGLIVATGGRLIASALVLAIPTLAMGGTLPAAARAVTMDTDVRRQSVAMLYGINTLGAVAGCMLSTFWMLEIYGTRQTLWLAAAVNILIAVAARQLSERAGGAGGAGRAGGAAENELEPSLPAGPARPGLPAFLLTASGTVGFAFFLLELIWYRLLAPLLGGSVFTFGLVLALALAGIGIGGLVYALVSSDRPASLYGFAGSCLLEAAMAAATYALGDRLALLALALMPLKSAGFAAQAAGWTAVASLVVLPPALVAGYQFPLLIALFGRAREGLGRQVGLAYAANTLGAIVGSLAGGFGLLPWLSAPTAWKLVAIVLAVLGTAAAILAESGERRARSRREASNVYVSDDASSPRTPRTLRTVFALLVVATVGLLFAAGPTAVWRHSGIGAGRTPPTVIATPNALRGWEQSVHRAVEWDGDGVESSVALSVEQSGYAFIVNGKSDGSARSDAGTQVMLGLLAALRAPQPKRALVIGLGTGSTAGWLAAVPTMERVDVVELEPLILKVARECEPVNHDALDNPKLHVTIGDARETLLTGRDQYDIVASEPSNPFRAGIASLFTTEYYRAARERMSPDGVFAQWIQGYEIDARTLRTIYLTLGSVFPHIETWQTERGDLVLLASTTPARYQARALSARIAEEPFRSALADSWRVTDIAGLFAHYVGSDRLGAAVGLSPGVEINTDDRNVVEFGLARSVGQLGSYLVVDIRRFATANGFHRPPLDDAGSVSWEQADTAWLNFNGWSEGAATIVPAASADEQLRRDALRRYYDLADIAGARELWKRQNGRPRDLNELAMAADIEADTGSDAAQPLIDQLRSYEPGEADTVLALLRLKQSRLDESAAALRAAFASFDSNPWPLVSFKQKALTLAGIVATQKPALARPLYDALARPFAIRAIDDVRLYTAAGLAATANDRALCRAPLSALEPYVPWRGDLLQLRADCYRATGDAHLRDAVRDLNDYNAREPQPIVNPR
ncbi:MAG TPA: fused MFS/spermidine synthase [Vicinamibacterales bacterium]|nr:fused MFS/spermidine synthase [Vicinamibacterales bacterium]